jgi:hypothetical protein
MFKYVEKSYATMDSEFDLVARCIKCTHHKVDHDINSIRDKMKCLIFDNIGLASKSDVSPTRNDYVRLLLSIRWLLHKS